MRVTHCLWIFIGLLLCSSLYAQEKERVEGQLGKEVIPESVLVVALSEQIQMKDIVLKQLFQMDDLFYQRRYAENFPIQGGMNYYQSLSENMSVSTWHGSEVYPGLGGLTGVDALFTWKPNQHFILSGGMYVTKMFYHPGQLFPITDGGVNMDVRYLLNDRLSFHAFGTYSAADKMEWDVPMFFPQNTVGGGVRYMFNDHFGMEGGVIYQGYNGRMRPNAYVSPIIKAGNVTIELRPSISTGKSF